MSEQNGTGGEWEKELLNRLAFSALSEQRRARRWGIFFKSLGFVYLFALLIIFTRPGTDGSVPKGPHTALVELRGTISDASEANADTVVAGLRAAFKDRDTKGIVLRINSPGGSPVQSGYIYDEIRRLRQQHPETPLYAVISDTCASGGYYVAAAADAIYANRASVVGSIGVLMNGFGFMGALEKLGVERRLYTAGEDKGFMDPFSPVRPDEEKHLKGLLAEIHKQFIEAVKTGRGERLKDDPRLFSGLIWPGSEAVKLGLVDGLGSADYVAREVIGVEEIVDFSAKPNYLERVFERFGTHFGGAVAEYLQAPTLR